MTVETIDRGMAAYLARLQEIDSLEIVAGHVGANALEPHPKSANVTKLQVSRFVQFGTARMPPRPYMDVAAQDLQSDPRVGRMTKGARSLRSKKSPVDALKPLGKRTARAVRDAIVAVGAVDTGATRDAVRYQIRQHGAVVHEGSASETLTAPRRKRTEKDKRRAKRAKQIKRAKKQARRAVKKATRRAKRIAARVRRALR